MQADKLRKLIVFIGPSGSGKSTLAQELLAHSPGITFVKTVTTRPRRSNDDESHEFVNDATFDELLMQGHFIGTLDIFGHRYGLPSVKTNSTCLLLLRAPAIPTLRQVYPDSLVIEIDAPIPTLISRLNARSSFDRADEGDLQKEIAAGRALTDLHIDTSHPIHNCLQQILEFIQDE